MRIIHAGGKANRGVRWHSVEVSVTCIGGARKVGMKLRKQTWARDTHLTPIIAQMSPEAGETVACEKKREMGQKSEEY